MIESRGNYFLKDNFVAKTDTLGTDFDNQRYPIYEVLRVIDGVPLYCEDHYARLSHSFELLQTQFQVSYNEFFLRISNLALRNNFREGNVKIIAAPESSEMIAFFIPHQYPGAMDYQTGVKCGLFNAERPNPHAKVFYSGLKQQVTNNLQETGYYEVFYVNKQNLITEGSRSNVFFIKNDIVYTCPASLVLLGITRQKVIECIQQSAISFLEKAVSVEEIPLMDAAFITGTSPKVLPVASIENKTYDTQNPVMKIILANYNLKIEEYISSRS